MKRLLAFSLTIIILSSLFIFPVNASEKDTFVNLGSITDVEYLDNGDCIVTYIEDGLTVVTGNSTNATTTVTKTKTKKYLNSAGDTMWYITVKGAFSYNGTTSKCTNVAHKAAAIGTTWSIKSASSSKSGNTATAKATAVHSTSTTSNEYTKSVSISCSKTGVIS